MMASQMIANQMADARRPQTGGLQLIDGRQEMAVFRSSLHCSLKAIGRGSRASGRPGIPPKNAASHLPSYGRPAPQGGSRPLHTPVQITAGEV